MKKVIIGDCELYLGDCRDILPTLVHETAHIWQRVRSAMDQPSDEFEACSMEYIFRNMLDDYDRSNQPSHAAPSRAVSFWRIV